jgi:hypothetical protein
VSEPQWLTLGREAAARALYETWHPTRTDNYFPEGAHAWCDLSPGERQRYLDAATVACESYYASTLESARHDLASFMGAPVAEEKPEFSSGMRGAQQGQDETVAGKWDE